MRSRWAGESASKSCWKPASPKRSRTKRRRAVMAAPLTLGIEGDPTASSSSWARIELLNLPEATGGADPKPQTRMILIIRPAVLTRDDVIDLMTESRHPGEAAILPCA